jgi:predicted acyl esterase
MPLLHRFNKIVALTLLLIFAFYSLLPAGLPVKKTFQVPMRDGVRLPTDVYLPDQMSRNLPCILVRSPAGCEQRTALAYVPLTADGFAVAIQATRSHLDKEGKTLPFRSDGWLSHQDGYDTVEWLAKQPMTNGKIGTLGFSAQGITQLLMAPSAPPSLVCQYIGVAAPSLRDHAIFPHGKMRQHQVEAWLGYYARDTGVFSFAANQQHFDDFWDEFDSLKVVDRVKVPGFFVAGWFDVFLQGTLDAFTARQERGGDGAKGSQKLIVGPWTHFWPDISKLGDFEIPAAGKQPPFDISPKRWFDHYLKGNSNRIDKEPAVTYYVMGPFDGSSSSGNVWRQADRWPVPSQETFFYLAQGVSLQQDLPVEKKAVVSFKHDPTAPVPTVGGCNLFIQSGPVDQKPVESRNDVLLFTSSALLEDMEVTGNIAVTLYVSSDCDDTDFSVRLTDVYPDGRSILIADGTYRIGLLKTQDVDHATGSIHPIEVNLGPTSMVFAKGHCIRLIISGSNYPRYELNCNVGLLSDASASYKVATNNVFFGHENPSVLKLPVVKP